MLDADARTTFPWTPRQLKYISAYIIGGRLPETAGDAGRTVRLEPGTR
jgi:hypothetical protein